MLAVRDLASGFQLAWLPVHDEKAGTAIDLLKVLFLQHGPPCPQVRQRAGLHR